MSHGIIIVSMNRKTHLPTPTTKKTLAPQSKLLQGTSSVNVPIKVLQSSGHSKLECFSNYIGHFYFLSSSPGFEHTTTRYGSPHVTIKPMLLAQWANFWHGHRGFKSFLGTFVITFSHSIGVIFLL